jgi:4-amino-4-deoxy-L-arabinose transferase-like glycosyltransferase
MHQDSILKFVLAGPVVFFLPGAALIMYIRDRYEANLLAVEVIVLSLCSSLVISSLVGLVMAELSVYSLRNLVAACLVITLALAAVWLVRRRGMRPHGATLFDAKWFQLGMLALAILAGFLFIGRWEAILTERDVSPYLIEGVNIADHGQIFLQNNTLATLTPAQAAMLYGGRGARSAQEYVSGYLIKDQKAGVVATRYFPLYSVILAVGLKLFGLRGTLTVLNPYIAFLALLAVALALRRLLGSGTALLAGLLLALSPLTLWFARYPISEMFTMMLVFLGIFALLLYYPRGNGYWGMVAALAFGLSFTTRYELYPLLIPLAAIMIVFMVRSRRRKEPLSYFLWFFVPLGLLLVHAIFTQIYFAGDYFSELSSQLFPQFGHSAVGKAAVLALPILAVVCLVLLIPRVRHWLRKSLAPIGRQWRYLFAAALLLIFLYAYLVRPNMNDNLLDKTLFRMSWYFTHIGLLLFAIGLAIFVVKGLKFKTMSLFLICGFFTALLFYRPACNPLHFWYIRRYMPAVVPFMAGLMAFAVVKAPSLFKDRQVRKAIGGIGMAAVLAVLVFSSIYTAKVYPVVQYDGALKSINDINALIGGGDTGAIFYGKWGFVYYTDIMRYMLGIDAVPLVGDRSDPKLFDSVYRNMKSRDSKVFLVGSGDLIPHATSDLVLQPVDSVIVSLQVLQPQYDVRPGEVVPFGFPLYVYELKDRGASDTYSVDVGGADSIAVRSGFYEPEATRSRWTAGIATFTLPNLGTQNRLALTMDVALGSRPRGSGQAVPMKVFAGGRFIGEAALTSPDFKPLTFQFDRGALPDPNAKNIEFRVEVPPWNPVAVPGKPADTRSLGVMIDRLAIQPAGQ